LLNDLLVNSGFTIETVTYHITPHANGCDGILYDYVVTVYPTPNLSNTPLSKQQCNNTATNITLNSNVSGTLFTWTCTPSSVNLSGFYNNATPSGLLDQTLINSGFTIETVNYHIIPHPNGCDGPVTDYVVTVYPVPDAYFIPASQAICPLQTSSISNNSHVAGASFTWTASGSSALVSGFSPGSGSSIRQTLNNTGYNIESVTYHVSPSANGCPGINADVVVTVHPDPVVTFTACFDPVFTTDAQPVKLKGGTPLSGSYSGTGVMGSTFFPATAGAGMFTISYIYANTYGCRDTAMQTISVISPLPFNCGSTLTDPRDNKTYPTVLIGTQCWMAANLDYGSTITAVNMQRDNCVPEKYCFNDNPGNCSTSGGLYQWDEMMKYDNASASQGICPPAWHVPTEAQWNTLFSFYISNGFAGSPLKNTGYSGFNAFLDGVRFKNVNWNFLDFATFFWSSTTHGPYKAWAHGMNSENPSVSYYPASKSNGFSIRCIKD
jgi:uncharacterized protein (TIGR02145 family)